jgi:hypothetical protein
MQKSMQWFEYLYNEIEKREQRGPNNGRSIDILSFFLSQFDPLTIFSFGNIPCK